MQQLLGSLIAGLVFGAGVLALFWRGERFVPAGLRRWLADALAGRAVGGPAREWAQVFRHLFDGWFGADPLSARFLLGSAALSLLGVAFFFVAFVLGRPGFAASLIDDPLQRAAVARQLLSVFLFVNLVVDYLSLAWCREIVARMARDPRPARLPLLLAGDLAMKLAVFAGLMGFLVVMLIGGDGSGGGLGRALRLIPLTLWGAMRFENLAAVFLWSGLLSSFWLWAFVAARFAFAPASPVAGWLARTLPVAAHPVRALGLVGAAAATLAWWLVAALS